MEDWNYNSPDNKIGFIVGDRGLEVCTDQFPNGYLVEDYPTLFAMHNVLGALLSTWACRSRLGGGMVCICSLKGGHEKEGIKHKGIGYKDDPITGKNNVISTVEWD